MSILSLAHHFCDMNKLSVAEFCRYFSVQRSNGNAKPNELIDPEKSSLNYIRLASRLGPQRGHHDELFVSYHGVTGIEAEIERKLRYCSQCLKQGYHFAFHQLTWLSHCPIHQVPLSDHCSCKKQPRFMLSRIARPPKQLCACGELQLGNECEFKPIELSRLEDFIVRASTLRENLAMGLCSIRIASCKPDAKELLNTYKLIRHVLSGLAEFPSHFAGLPTVEHRWLNFLPDDPLSIIDCLFERYFSEAAARRHWDAAETRRRCDIVAFLERQLLGRGARCAATSLFEKNASDDAFDDEILTYAIAATTIRVLEDAHKLNMSIARDDDPNFKKIAEAYGHPMCLLWTARNTPVTPHVFWLADCSHDFPSVEPWIDDLARFYLRHTLVKCYSPNAVEKKLIEAEEQKARNLRFAFPGGANAAPTQRDLFGNLEALRSAETPS